MAETSIEWCDSVWNPTTGCDKVSPGCDNCYALTMAKRLQAMGQAKYRNDGDPRTSGPGFGLTMHEDALSLPLRWRKPRSIFVNSMSDLFHPKVSDEFIARVFRVMSAARQHTFLVLTKRAARMQTLLASDRFDAPVFLRNVRLGVSVENQEQADARIPRLRRAPAVVRWLSCEPLLGPLDLSRHWVGAPQWGPEYPEPTSPTGLLVQDLVPGPTIDWVVAGGESGPAARPMHPAWPRSLRDQCVAAGVPFFFKQHGAWQPGSAMAGQRGEDHVIVFDGRHEPATPEHFDGKTGLARARSFHEPGTDQACMVSRVGKKAAGRELDGRTWDEFPGIALAAGGGR